MIVRRPEQPLTIYFQIFNIGEIVSLAQGNYTALAIKGGVIGIRYPGFPLFRARFRWQTL